MSPPMSLFIASLLAFGLTLTRPDLNDWAIVAASAVLASLVLWVKGGGHRGWFRAPAVVIDGSNVLFWKETGPGLEPLQEVLKALKARGVKAGVIFDANVGYLLHGKYMDDRHLAEALNLPTDRVLVVGRGTQADPIILRAARETGARVVTNDRYRDWAADFPEVAKKGFLIRGGFRNGSVWFDESA